MALGGSNQAVASDTPSLKAANADPVPRPSWPGVRAGKSPAILGFVGLGPKVIHDHAKIREGSHKGLRHLGDCVPSDGRRAIVDTQRRLMRVECRHALGILAAPRRCVAGRQVPQVDRVRQHRGQFYQTRTRERMTRYSERAPNSPTPLSRRSRRPQGVRGVVPRITAIMFLPSTRSNRAGTSTATPSSFPGRDRHASTIFPLSCPAWDSHLPPRARRAARLPCQWAPARKHRGGLHAHLRIRATVPPASGPMLGTSAGQLSWTATNQPCG